MTVLCDLDGVIYRGASALPGVAEALTALDRAGIDVYFITNNSSRTPEATAEKITKLTGVEVRADQVLTSSMAAMTMLGPEDDPILVVGAEGVTSAVADAGFDTTDDPMKAGAVVVGLDRGLTYDTITGAMRAVRNGARFIATNDDATFPTEDGLEPGCGAIVAAIATAAQAEPEVAGKPNKPMRDLIRTRVGGEAWVIGDRIDTDIALAHSESGWEAILVLTGIATAVEAETAGVELVVDDFAAAADLVLRRLHPS